MSGTTCEAPGVFGRVPIARPVTMLTRSAKLNSWLVNMFMCFAILLNALRTTKRLSRQSIMKAKGNTKICITE